MCLLAGFSAQAQTPNGTCLSAEPFCTGTAVTFPAGVGTGTAQAGPNYGCLLTQPNPAWYFMELDQSGNLDIEITNSNNEDIDFILYGPFVDPILACTALLTAGNTEDCSYSTSATEVANVVGGIAGEFYLLLIVNFSNNATDISFVDLASSTATTNCAIVCPPIDFGVWNGATVEQTPLTMDCDDAPVLLLVDEDGFNPGVAISPCVVIQVFPTSANTTLSVEFFENGTSLGTLVPGVNTNWSGYLSLADPTVSHSWVLDEGNATGGNMTYQVLDCHTGTVLASGTWVADGNPQTVTVNPPPNLAGTAVFTVTPATGNPGLTTFAWGGAVWDPSLVPIGSYDITYSWDDGAGNCAGSAMHTFIVTNPYDASWTSLGTICESAGSINLNTVGSPTQGGGTWSGTGVSGNTFNPTGLSGAINVTYTVGTGGSCIDASTQSITVIPDVDPAWTSPGTVCETAGNINLNSLITGTTGGTWSGTGVSGNTFNPTGLSGAISITYQVGAAPCQESSVQNITVEPDVDPSWTTPGSVCATAGNINLNTLITGTTGGTWSGTGVTGNTFNPAGLSGSINITYSIGNSPCDEASTQAIAVEPDVDPAWTSPGTICETAGNINLNTLITGTTGGTWSGAGVTGNTFNPTGLSGSINVTYSVGNSPCDEASVQSITVEPDVDPSWTTPGTVCESAGNINLNTLITGTTGGSWSGSGVTGNTFNPAGLSGNVTVTYSVGNVPCAEVSAQTITVEPDVDPSWTSPGTVCESAGNINLNTLITGTTGGTWSGTGVTGNTFNPTGLSGSINVTYSVGNSPCDESSVQAITVEPDVDASWTTPGVVCESSGAIDLDTTITGTTGGTWSGTGMTGSNFDPSGLSGNISITYSVGNAPCAEISVQVINVITQPDASWTSPGDYCEAAGTLDLTTLITGTTGGTWSGTGVTGSNFNPTGLSGNINITYTVGSVPCQEILAQNINVVPDVDPSWTTPGVVCESGGAVDLSTTITGTTGGTWSGTGVTGTTFDPSGLSGNVNVTYTVGTAPCVEVSMQVINVITQPSAAWTPPVDYCEATGVLDLTTLITGTTGGTWSGTGVTGSNFDPTGLSGNINITYTVGSIPCQEVLAQDINVVPVADPSWIIPPALCENASAINLDLQISGLTGGAWSGSGVTGSMFDPAGLAGNVSITYTVGTLPCLESSTQDIVVNPFDDATFTYPANTYCQSNTDPSPTATLPGGSYSAPGGLSIDASTGLIDLSLSTPGLYTVTYATNGICPNSGTFDVTVVIDDDPSFAYSTGTYCLTGSDQQPVVTGLQGGTFSGTGTVVLAANGTIDLDASGLGSYDITYTTNGPCPQSMTVTITITDAPSANFTYAGPYCQGSAANGMPTFSPGASGGVFNGVVVTGGPNIVFTGVGEIDLGASDPGTYDVTNFIAASGGCAAASSTTQVTIDPQDDPTFTYASPYCQSDLIATAVITGTGGGAFSESSGGVVFNNTATGEIDLLATAPGTYTILYVTSGTCLDSTTVNVTITADDDPTFSYPSAQYCLDAADPFATITGTANGAFTATPAGLNIDPNTGLIDLGASTGNTTYTITYTTAGLCPASSSVNVTVDSVDSPLFSYTQLSYCTTDPNQFATITGTTGGTFTALPATLIIDPVTGEVDVVNSPVGNFTIIYTTNGACPSFASVPFTITSALDPTVTLVGPFCSNDAAITMTAVDGGGTWSGPGIIDGVLGTFDPGAAFASGAGPYQVVYAIAGGCGGTDTVDVQVDQSFDATINNAPASICEDADAVDLDANDAGGTWSGSGVDPVTGVFDPVAAGGAGSYTIVYEIVAACGDINSVIIVVNPAPAAPTGIDATACDGDPTPALGAIGGGGTFTWYDNANGTLPTAGNGATWTPSVTGNGVYTYWVSETLGACEGPLTAVILTITGPTAFFIATPDNGMMPLDVYFDNQSAGGSTYDWTFGHDGATSNLFDPNYLYTDWGAFTASLIVTDTNGCADNYSVDIDVDAESEVDVPNVFSPNGDGSNDMFMATSENLSDLSGTVMNRWGQVVFTWIGPEAGWDGYLSSGAQAPDGVYYYIIVGTGADGIPYEFVGHVTLIR
jgi:gliding motility-associated-like protein